MGRGPKIGGGIGGGIILLLAALFGINPQLLEGLAGTAQEPQTQSQGTAPACKTGADADARLDCRITGTVNSLNAFWPAYLAKYNTKYPRPEAVIFTGGTNTGCGAATSDVGPFYCPVDTTAYFDPGFFQELVDRFGSSGGPLAQEYVVAHEFGHHVQNLLGDLDRAQQDPQGPHPAESGLNSRPTATPACGPTMPRRSRTRRPASPTSIPSPNRTSRMPCRPPRPWAMTESRRPQPGACHRRPGPTDPVPSGRSGSTRGYTSGDINQCDTFAVATP